MLSVSWSVVSGSGESCFHSVCVRFDADRSGTQCPDHDPCHFAQTFLPIFSDVNHLCDESADWVWFVGQVT